VFDFQCQQVNRIGGARIICFRPRLPACGEEIRRSE